MIMVLDRKQFDDFDDFTDFDEKLDPSSDLESTGGMRGNSSLSWRRAIIERAAINVRKAVESKTDLHLSYKSGTLVFDDEANKFGRVVESRPGFLNVSLLTGGKLVKQDMDQLDFIKKNRQKMTLPELAKELSLTEVEIIALLNQIELALEPAAAKKPAVAVASENKVRAAVAAKAQKLALTKKPELKKVVSENKNKAVAQKAPSTKPAIKIAAKSNKARPKKPVSPAKAGAPTGASFAKFLPKGVSTDPVVDPNGYIKQNFLLMSNKELARATSLSEHTIRRKLGEWGLKRKEPAKA